MSCFYIDGYAYQENELVRQNIRDGHEVEVVASVENYNQDGKLYYGEPGVYVGSDGAKVTRFPYKFDFFGFIGKKLRIHRGLYKKIESFAPDVILFHGACGWEINTAAKYVSRNKNTVLYVDSHEDFINSARGFVSKWVLHWAYYRPILLRNLKKIQMVLPVSVSCFEFMRDFYGVPSEKLEFYPLGGMVPDEAEYATARAVARTRLGVAEDQIIFVQSGKIGAEKKLVEALQAFRKLDDPSLRFFVAGLILPEVQKQVEDLVAADPRVELLGWQSPEDLRNLLCAADVYSQPGTQSATMQMSIAHRCAVILDDVSSHEPYVDGNGWLVGRSLALDEAFAEAVARKDDLKAMAQNSYKIALRLLDYRLLAARLYQPPAKTKG